MAKLERLITLAEDELVQYSTNARKIEKLRQKIGLSLNVAEQKQAKAELLAAMPTDDISQIVEKNRQTVSSFLGHSWTRIAAWYIYGATTRFYCHCCWDCGSDHIAKMGLETPSQAPCSANPRRY